MNEMNTTYIIRVWNGDLKKYQYIAAPIGFYRSANGILRRCDSAKGVEWTYESGEAMNISSKAEAHEISKQFHANCVQIVKRKTKIGF